MNAVQMKISLCLSIILTLIFCSGCGELRVRPKRAYNTNDALIELNIESAISRMISEYYGTTLPETRKDTRDTIVSKVLIVTDIHYHDFIESVSVFKKKKDTAAEIGVVAASGVASLIHPLSTAQIFSQVSVGIQSSNIAVNKNFFYEQTIPVLISSMNARRLTVRADIVRNVKLGTQNYPLQAALADLDRYYNAGTFEGAVELIAKKAGDEKKEAEERINKAYEDALKKAEKATKEYELEKELLISSMSDMEAMTGLIDQAVKGFRDYIRASGDEKNAIRLIQSELYDLVAPRKPLESESSEINNFLGTAVGQVEGVARFEIKEYNSFQVTEEPSTVSKVPPTNLLTNFEALLTTLRSDYTPRNRELVANLVIMVRELIRTQADGGGEAGSESESEESEAGGNAGDEPSVDGNGRTQFIEVDLNE